MGRRGKPAMSRRELRIAYQEACAEIRRLNDQLSEMVQDNIRLSGRLAELDLGQDRLDVFVVPLDQSTEELPAPPPLTVDLMKRPKYRGLSSMEAVADMRSFMIRIHEAAGDTTAVQELRIL
jgi:hypothetical protein